MNTIPVMPTLSMEEIIKILEDCKEKLGFAYQESHISDFWQASISAGRVRDYFLYVLHKQTGVETIH